MSSGVRRSLVLVLLLVGALVVAACGSEDEPETVAVPGVADADTGSGDGGLVLPTTTGGQIAFNDLLGTPTMLWFWAPW